MDRTNSVKLNIIGTIRPNENTLDTSKKLKPFLLGLLKKTTFSTPNISGTPNLELLLDSVTNNKKILMHGEV